MKFIGFYGCDDFVNTLSTAFSRISATNEILNEVAINIVLDIAQW